MSDIVLQTLLSPSDPDPVTVLNAERDTPVLLLCEHAGRAIPNALGDLGLPDRIRDTHIGWDIGAENMARRLAQRLGATLILQNYSRLVVDANRPPGSAGFIPASSDGIAIPGNARLSRSERDARRQEIFAPFDDAIANALEVRKPRAVFSIHSFTTRLGDAGHSNAERPWHAGFLSRKSIPTARRMMASVAQTHPNARLALNEPYRIEDDTDWFIPAHAERLGLPHCLVEIRNDQIDHDAGSALWAGLLADAIGDVLGSLP